MQRNIVNVPLTMMRQARVEWDIDWRGQSVGERTDGVTQVVHNAFPRWVGLPDLIVGRALLGRWRATRWQAQGRVGVYRLPMYDPALFNPFAVNPTLLASGLPFSSGERFSTGLGFAYAPAVTATATAAAGDTVISIAYAAPELRPSPGQIMSAKDWPFGVTAVTDTGPGQADLTVVRFNAAISAGDLLDLVGWGHFEAVDDVTGRLVYGSDLTARFSFHLQEVLVR